MNKMNETRLPFVPFLIFTFKSVDTCDMSFNFLFRWMKNNSEPNEGENLYFPRSSFGARRKKVKTEMLKNIM